MKLPQRGSREWVRVTGLVALALETPGKQPPAPSWFCACGHLKKAHRPVNTETRSISSACTFFVSFIPALRFCMCSEDFSEELGRTR